MIYICIPTRDEQSTIGVLLWKVRQVLANFPRDYQILVANDASTDATAEVLEPYERVMPVRVFHNQARLGYATSLELLIREVVKRAEYPKRDVIVTLQADFTEDPDDLVGLLKRIEAGADVVCGEAQVGNALPRQYRWGRKLAQWLLARRGLPEGVTDPITGLRAYRVQALKRTLEGREGARLLTWDGWAANAELLYQVVPNSRRTEAVPVGFRPERLRRPTRFDVWSVLKDAFSFSRGRSGPLAGVALEPLREREAPARQRGRPGTSRGASVSNGARSRPARENGQRARDRDRNGARGHGEARGERGSRGDRPARGDRPPRGERPARERPARGERRPRGEDTQAAASGERRERRPRPEKPAVVAAPAPPDLAEPDQPVVEGAPARRKRRRGGRKRTGARPAPDAGLEAVTGEEPESSQDGAEAESAPGDPGLAADADGEQQKRRKRTRGRRGGRGRSRSRSGAVDGAETNEQTMNAEPAESPPATLTMPEEEK